MSVAPYMGEHSATWLYVCPNVDECSLAADEAAVEVPMTYAGYGTWDYDDGVAPQCGECRDILVRKDA